jgi:uncharacterized membrane protein
VNGMSSQTPLLNAHRLRLLAWLVILITSGYMFTYNGRIESSDTRTLFNATASLVQYNDLLLDKTAWYNLPSPVQPPAIYPLSTFDAGPLQVILSGPLFWVAEHLPGIGLVHTVWLFNIIVGTAIGALMFLYVLTLGYSESTAVFATLILSFTTIIWPYSKTFFREPLAAFLILLVAFSLERWRSGGYRSPVRLGLSVAALAAGLLTKEAIVLALPALFILVLPPVRSADWQRRLHLTVTVFLILVIVSLVVFILLPALLLPRDLSLFDGFLSRSLHINRKAITYVHVAIHSYLFSVGGSVWGTSPVGLLAIPGLWMLYRKRHYRYIGAVVAVVVGFALGYALLRGEQWFGGLSWPPRFLVPAVPFLVITALPPLNRVLQHLTRIGVAVVAVIVIYGLWIQISAVSLDWGSYNTALPPEANGLGEWNSGLNNLHYLRWVIIPSLWSRFWLDFAWVRVGIILWPLVCVSLVLLSSFWLWRLLKFPSTATSRPLWARWLPAAGLLAVPLLIFGGLRAIYPDSLYLGGDQPLHNFMPVLQANTRPGDILLLANNNYEPFFLNYGDFDVPRVITLPDQPGERSNPDEPPEITSLNPDALLVKDTVVFLYNLAASHDHLWLLADTGPWIPWSVRPVERFMVAHYYPIREFSTDPPDPHVRLIEYSTVHAPDPFAFRGPDTLSDLRYGDSIRLVGFNLPLGTRYKPGSVLPISLYWQSDTRLDEDYTVAWFIADENGNPVIQGADTPPAGGFAATTSWQPDVAVWDNRALYLPGDVQPGHYVIWVRLYTFDPSGKIHLLPMSGGKVQDDTIGVLPVTIDVQP